MKQNKHLSKLLRQAFESLGIKNSSVLVPANAKNIDGHKILVNPLKRVMKEVLSKSFDEQNKILKELQENLAKRAAANLELENG